MFAYLFTRALTLEIGDRDIRFPRVQDLEFALASRTEVPADKVSALIELSPNDLLKEAADVRETEKRFLDLIAKSLEDPSSIGYLLRQVDIKQYSQDHEWRDIMRALVSQPAKFNAFKQIAVAKYAQYLGCRQDVLKSLYSLRGDAARNTPEEHDVAAFEEEMRQTVIIDLNKLPMPKPSQSDSFERLPRGQKVDLHIAPGSAMELVLSRNRFKLHCADQSYLSDEASRRYPLKSGSNLVGREPECDIVLETDSRDVSRRHFVVELRSPGDFTLTDLSSHGTFVPRSFLGQAHPAVQG
jgi:hypothetical protein